MVRGSSLEVAGKVGGSYITNWRGKRQAQMQAEAMLRQKNEVDALRHRKKLQQAKEKQDLLVHYSNYGMSSQENRNEISETIGQHDLNELLARNQSLLNKHLSDDSNAVRENVLPKFSIPSVSTVVDQARKNRVFGCGSRTDAVSNDIDIASSTDGNKNQRRQKKYEESNRERRHRERQEKFFAQRKHKFSASQLSTAQKQDVHSDNCNDLTEKNDASTSQNEPQITHQLQTRHEHENRYEIQNEIESSKQDSNGIQKSIQHEQHLNQNMQTQPLYPQRKIQMNHVVQNKNQRLELMVNDQTDHKSLVRGPCNYGELATDTAEKPMREELFGQQAYMLANDEEVHERHERTRQQRETQEQQQQTRTSIVPLSKHNAAVRDEPNVNKARDTNPQNCSLLPLTGMRPSATPVDIMMSGECSNLALSPRSDKIQRQRKYAKQLEQQMQEKSYRERSLREYNASQRFSTEALNQKNTEKIQDKQRRQQQQQYKHDLDNQVAANQRRHVQSTKFDSDNSIVDLIERDHRCCDDTQQYDTRTRSQLQCDEKNSHSNIIRMEILKSADNDCVRVNRRNKEQRQRQYADDLRAQIQARELNTLEQKQREQVQAAEMRAVASSDTELTATILPFASAFGNEESNAHRGFAGGKMSLARLHHLEVQDKKEREEQYRDSLREQIVARKEMKATESARLKAEENELELRLERERRDIAEQFERDQAQSRKSLHAKETTLTESKTDQLVEVAERRSMAFEQVTLPHKDKNDELVTVCQPSNLNKYAKEIATMKEPISIQTDTRIRGEVRPINAPSGLLIEETERKDEAILNEVKSLRENFLQRQELLDKLLYEQSAQMLDIKRTSEKYGETQRRWIAEHDRRQNIVNTNDTVREDSPALPSTAKYIQHGDSFSFERADHDEKSLDIIEATLPSIVFRNVLSRTDIAAAVQQLNNDSQHVAENSKPTPACSCYDDDECNFCTMHSSTHCAVASDSKSPSLFTSSISGRRRHQVSFVCNEDKQSLQDTEFSDSMCERRLSPDLSLSVQTLPTLKSSDNCCSSPIHSPRFDFCSLKPQDSEDDGSTVFVDKSLASNSRLVFFSASPHTQHEESPRYIHRVNTATIHNDSTSQRLSDILHGSDTEKECEAMNENSGCTDMANDIDGVALESPMCTTSHPVRCINKEKTVLARTQDVAQPTSCELSSGVQRDDVKENKKQFNLNAVLSKNQMRLGRLQELQIRSDVDNVRSYLNCVSQEDEQNTEDDEYSDCFDDDDDDDKVDLFDEESIHGRTRWLPSCPGQKIAPTSKSEAWTTD